MSKSLDALQELRENGACSFAYGTITFTYLAFTQRADIIEKDLKRLEQLETMYSNCVIEGAKQKKALEIIKNKNVNVTIFKGCDSLEEYNKHPLSWKKLIQEEWVLLKEVLL